MTEKNFYKFIWLGALVSIVLCAFMLMNMLRIRSQTGNIKEAEVDAIIAQILEIKQKIQQKQNHISELEESALWNSQIDMMQFLTEQAQKAKVSIIGVEQISTREVDMYSEMPVKLTLKGDYHACGRFLNNLERSQDRVKISYFSIKQHKRFPEHMIELILSNFRRLDVVEQP